MSVYSILGMQLYQGKFESQSDRNFDSFEKSFMTVFSVITMDNWDSILIDCMKVDSITSVFYILSMIFFLGFMMFNLLITVLLHGFENLLQGDLKVYGGKLKEEYNLFKIKKILSKYNSLKEKINQNNFFQNSLENDDDNYNFFGTKRSVRHTGQNLVGSDRLIKINSTERVSKSNEDRMMTIKRLKKFYLLNFDFSNKNSCFIFNDASIIRIICRRINNSHIFHQFVYMNLIISLMFISAETFFNYSDNKYLNFKKLIHSMSFVTYTIFAIDTIVKSIDLGFVLRKNSYLRSSANFIDFFSIIGFIIEIFLYLGSNEYYLRLTQWSFFRILRAINITYQNEKMKLLLKAILKSLHGLLSVTLIVLTVW